MPGQENGPFRKVSNSRGLSLEAEDKLQFAADSEEEPGRGLSRGRMVDN